MGRRRWKGRKVGEFGLPLRLLHAGGDPAPTWSIEVSICLTVGERETEFEGKSVKAW